MHSAIENIPIATLVDGTLFNSLSLELVLEELFLRKFNMKISQTDFMNSCSVFVNNLFLYEKMNINLARKLRGLNIPEKQLFKVIAQDNQNYNEWLIFLWERNITGRLNIAECLEQYTEFVLKLLEADRGNAQSILKNTPVEVKSNIKLYKWFPDLEQVKYLNTISCDIFNKYWLMTSTNAKIRYLYHILKSNSSFENIRTVVEDSNLEYAILSIVLDVQGKRKDEYFIKFHMALQELIIGAAWDLNRSIDLDVFLPKCPIGLTSYCEGKPSEQKKDEGSPFSGAWCPRTAKLCSDNLSRITPRVELEYNNWTLLEFIKITGITPRISELKNHEEYVNKMSGWVNRLNEIRERLRCKECNAPLVANKKYSINLARYNSTVFSCQEGDKHDSNVYISHCWSCKKIIDSRESIIQDEQGYYICIHCGTGSQRSRHKPGDVCPKCGNVKGMQKKHNNVMECLACGHEIEVVYHKSFTQ